MKKILAVIVNYGTDQLHYLKRMINEFNNFEKYSVDIIVHSNIPIDLPSNVKINIIKLNDYQLLPLTTRTSIFKNKDNYDIFIYSENDHLFLEHHIDKFLEYNEILPNDRISGLIQYEEKNGIKYFPALHAWYKWDPHSIEVYNGKKFAYFTNIHQGCFLITRKQLNNICKKYNFNNFIKGDYNQRYSVKCQVNTDIYTIYKRLICISDLEDNFIHHMPNRYVNMPEWYEKWGGIENNNKKMYDILKK
jgi:hypothetical protein